MKFLKTLLIVILFALVGGIVYVINLPDEFKVTRSIIVHVPAELAFEAVNDLKTYEDWGPCHEEDSTIVVNYGKETSGIHATHTWTSADSNGKIWMTEVRPNEIIRQKIQLENYEPGEMIWNFESLEDSTKLLWTIKSDKAPFVFKLAAVYSGGWENMLAPSQEKGLDNLSEMLSKQYEENRSFSISDPKIVSLDSVQFMGIKVKTKIDNESMSDAFSQYIPIVTRQVMQHGLNTNDFTPGAVFYKWDEAKNESTMLIGVKLKENITLKDLAMDTYSTLASKAVMVTKFGNYGNGDREAHAAIGEFINHNQFTPEYPIFELYSNDPGNVKPKDIQTDIYYPLLD